jgi:ATP-dependent helicase HrpB
MLPEAVRDLPVAGVLEELEGALDRVGAAVLCAPPGSGKTTLAPLGLLRASWLAGAGIVMLEPRRLAARAAAARMASLLGEDVGGRVGHRVRFDTRVSARTRIEVVTEGVLTRRVQRDPSLEGVGLVILDEYHERTMEADLALALVLDARRGLREDLRVLVMSATLDAAAVSALLGNAPMVHCAGRTHPVEVTYLEREPPGPLAPTVAQGVERALAAQPGDVLAFLPGGREIRAVAERLEGRIDALVCPLYGDLPRVDQDRAIRPDADGRRRVVLATNIAETSLTIEGVGAVVDAGLERAPRFDPNTGLTRLETVRIARASAEQRAGRAGRLGPGLCLRLWTEAAHARLRAHAAAEIGSADLAPLALELARWGVTDPGALDWLDVPPPGAYAQATELLRVLGALDARGRITPTGQSMARLPVHPRLARMVLAAPAPAARATACRLAALLEEGDPLRGRADTADVAVRLRALGRARADPRPGRGGASRVDRAARSIARALDDATRRAPGPGPGPGVSADSPGALLVLAYPDRVARQRGAARERYVLASGRAALLREGDPLAGEPWLVVAALDAGREQGLVHLAAAVSEREVHVRRSAWARWCSPPTC